MIPSAADRPKFGIPECTAEGGGIDPCHSYDVYECVVVDQQMRREDEWLRRIKSTKFENGLVIYGVAHGLSFGAKLRSSGIAVPKLYSYIPHSLVCPRGPHRF